MSTAIRNFLIVFLLFLVIFGLVAWKVAVPYIDEVLLGESDKGTDVDVSQVIEESETSGDSVETGRNRKLSLAFIGMANKEHVASIFFVEIQILQKLHKKAWKTGVFHAQSRFGRVHPVMTCTKRQVGCRSLF